MMNDFLRYGLPPLVVLFAFFELMKAGARLLVKALDASGRLCKNGLKLLKGGASRRTKETKKRQNLEAGRRSIVKTNKALKGDKALLNSEKEKRRKPRNVRVHEEELETREPKRSQRRRSQRVSCT